MSIRYAALFCVIFISKIAYSEITLKSKKKLYSASFYLQANQQIDNQEKLNSRGFSLFITKQRKRQKWLSLSFGYVFDFQREFHFYKINFNEVGELRPNSNSPFRPYYKYKKSLYIDIPLLVQFRLLNLTRTSLYTGIGISSTWLLKESYKWMNYKINLNNSAIDPGPFYSEKKGLSSFTLVPTFISFIANTEAAIHLSDKLHLLARLNVSYLPIYSNTFKWNVGLGIKRIL
ncbi:MAG TPA: hypothetical protein PL185_10670 [Flavobacteriales bacterium]|nr:hypothetical protein [Flavobacteriales bacterium]